MMMIGIDAAFRMGIMMFGLWAVPTSTCIHATHEEQTTHRNAPQSERCQRGLHPTMGECFILQNTTTFSGPLIHGCNTASRRLPDEENQVAKAFAYWCLMDIKYIKPPREMEYVFRGVCLPGLRQVLYNTDGKKDDRSMCLKCL